MNINGYGTIHGEHRKSKHRKIAGIIVIIIILLTGVFAIGVLTSTGPGYKKHITAIEENHRLKEQVKNLKEEVKELKAEIKEKDEYISTLPTPVPDEDEPSPTPIGPASPRE